jgi:hypothetical protein
VHELPAARKGMILTDGFAKDERAYGWSKE